MIQYVNESLVANNKPQSLMTNSSNHPYGSHTPFLLSASRLEDCAKRENHLKKNLKVLRSRKHDKLTTKWSLYHTL